MVAPEIKNLIGSFKRCKVTVDEKSKKYIDKLFEIIQTVEPIDNERRSLWLKAERGTIEQYGDFEKMKQEGMVDSYEQFEEWWLDEFPEDTAWYELFVIERSGYKAILLDGVLFYESKTFGTPGLPYDLSDLFSWVADATANAVAEMKAGVYNDNVEKYLSAENRTGTISRKDYWDIFPEERIAYFENITQEEIDEFVSLVADRKGKKPAGKYIQNMTARDFYGFCAVGYKANRYEMAEKLSDKELYYKYADGRDEGLADVDECSSEAFESWYNDSGRFGGHPWEVCRGGNSAHISLYVVPSEQGWYLVLAGRSWGRSIETIKFYNALRKRGIAVRLQDAEEIKARLLEKDLIGIVPRNQIPLYCESQFPEARVVDFINLPYDKTDEVIAKTTWHKEPERFLKKI